MDEAAAQLDSFQSPEFEGILYKSSIKKSLTVVSLGRGLEGFCKGSCKVLTGLCNGTSEVL